MEITISLAHHRVMYAFNIRHTLREHLFLRDLEKLANFGFVLAEESIQAEQRNRLEYSDPNPKSSLDFKGIDSIPLSFNIKLT